MNMIQTIIQVLPEGFVGPEILDLAFNESELLRRISGPETEILGSRWTLIIYIEKTEIWECNIQIGVEVDLDHAMEPPVQHWQEGVEDCLDHTEEKST